MAQPFQVNRCDLSDKATVFRFTFEKILFKYDGMFLLKLTVNNSILSDKSGVRIRTKNSDKFIKDFSVRTEMIKPSKIESFTSLIGDEYDFYLPKGFCKNDIDHDVYLHIEALQVLPNAKTQIIGTVKVPIYPRPNINANYNVDRGESFYRVKESVRLLRPNIKESNLHCGDLFCHSEFSEIIEIMENDIPQSPKHLVKKSPIPQSRSPPSSPPPPRPVPLVALHSKVVIEVSSEPFQTLESTDAKINQKKLINYGLSPPSSPKPPFHSVVPPAQEHSSKRAYHLLSPRGSEEVSVFVRAAENIFGRDRGVTVTHVTCGFKSDESESEATTATPAATSTPSWEEILNLTVNPRQIDRILALRIIDSNTSELIVEFVLPVGTLEPFFQHHLELCQSSPPANYNPILFVTVIRHLDHYPLTGCDFTFSALIIKPLSVFHRFESMKKHSLSCFAYLSNDRTQKISKATQSIADNFTRVLSPLPSNLHWPTGTKLHPMWSSGQLSLPTIIQDGHDTWNFPFLFCLKPEIDTAFSAHSFVVLDFYAVPEVSDGMKWRDRAPVAQSIVKLDRLLYTKLRDGAKSGVINTYDFNIDRKRLSLWTSEQQPLSDEVGDNKLRVKVVWTNENLTDGIFAEVDAFEPVAKVEDKTVPPVTAAITPAPTIKEHIKEEAFLYEIQPLKPSQSASYVFKENEGGPLKKKENLYKGSLKKMQIELLNLREQYDLLKSENESLEKKVSLKDSKYSKGHSDTLSETKNLSMSDLHQRYDQLRREFGTQISRLSDFKMKENDLRSAITYDGSQDAPADLYKNLKLTNDKLQRLERKAKEKEAIISRLEIILDGKEGSQGGIDESGTVTTSGDNSKDERSQLYDLIEKAENRIRALQNELIDLSRKKGARKQILRIREKEALFRLSEK